MAWWFFSFAAGESLVPMVTAAIAGLVALLALSARASGAKEVRGQLLEMSALLSVIALIGFLALSLVLPPSQGLNLDSDESPTALLRLATALSFLVGAISFNAAIALLLAGIWPRR